MKPKLKEAQCKLIERDLREGKKVTTWTAIQRHKITRISARIFNLRERGLNIITEMVERDGKRFAEYRLSQGGK